MVQNRLDLDPVLASFSIFVLRCFVFPRTISITKSPLRYCYSNYWSRCTGGWKTYHRSKRCQLRNDHVCRQLPTNKYACRLPSMPLYVKNLPPLHYLPLPESPSSKCQTIRILKLEPGSWDDPINCSLFLVDISTDPLNYEAISYVWGDGRDRRNVVCNGQRISVTRNLFDALQIFRQSQTAPRLLWADALCINQKDTGERNHQVQSMRLIYSKASRVLIWLGHAESDTVRPAMELVCAFDTGNRSKKEAHSLAGDEDEEDIGEDESTQDERVEDGDGEGVDEEEQCASYYWENAMVPSPVLPGTCSGLIKTENFPQLEPLFGCQWFKRLWVIQEVALSRSAQLFWGHASIDFRWICQVAKRIYENPSFASFLSTGLYNCYTMFQAWNQTGVHSSFLDVLSNTRNFSATDQRDKIFGILGIRTGDNNPEKNLFFVEPDYNLSESEIFKIVARKCLVELKRVDILSHVQHGSDVPSETASWAPNWGVTYTAVIGRWNRGYIGDVAPIVYAPECGEKDRMAIRGCMVDDVANVLKYDLSTSSFRYDINVFQLLRTFLSDLEDVLDSKTLSWTLTAGLDLDWNPIQDHRAHLAAFQAFLDWNPKQSEVSDEDEVLLPSTHPADIAFRYFSVPERMTYRRKFFKTGLGMLGLGPEAMQEGDIVAILFGSKTPFILRPAGSHYRLVGECYVYDIDGGNWFEEWQKSEQPTTDFHLI
ncbi:heterokaryon incompatibility protein-domain-containing protein [Massariosphaeria phaeospora]|uniref:Heterokaryon incompatibility protein-domain-containing protein n=1 Tax=Massariosphaeria phaeospora TaxID=100035 RepID=A0A7C8MDJ9_9PLEO|nr:heterokaryon incompatibility protein-domain-containing protein [Massariosphaeria phaeospora]